MHSMNNFIFIRFNYISIVFLSLVLKADVIATSSYPIGKENYFFLAEGLTSDNESTFTSTNPVNVGCFANETSDTALASNFLLDDFTFFHGTTVDNSTTSLSLQNAGSGTFSIQINRFKAFFGSVNKVVWCPGVLDISLKSNIVVSAYLIGGTASSSDYLESDDNIRVYFKLNSGAETLFFSDTAGLNGVNNGTTTTAVTSLAINRNTLHIVIKA